MKSAARRTVTSVAVALLAAMALVTNVLAASPTWTAAQDIRVRNNLWLNDADFSSRNVAISWDEPDSPRRVGVRTSTNGGTTFGPTRFLGGSRESAVDICGASELNMAMAHKVGPGNWVIEHAWGATATGSFSTAPVAPTDGLQHDPDVACAGGRVFASWFESEGDGDRMWIAHAVRGSGNFATPIDLGLDDNTQYSRSLAVAGVSDMAYAVFTRSDGDLRFKRWAIGGGPGFAVTPFASHVIANGQPGDQAAFALIAAEGSKVGVVWSRCSGIYARVSNDQGETWGPVRTLFNLFNSCEADAAAGQDSIAIRDGRIAVTYGIASAFGGGEVRLIRSNSDLATFSDDRIANRFHVYHFVGFVTVSGERKLAAAFQRGDVIRFRRQV